MADRRFDLPPATPRSGDRAPTAPARAAAAQQFAGGLLDFSSFAQVLKRQWKPAGLAFLATTALTLLILQIFPFKYSATASVLVALPTQRVVLNEEVVAAPGQDSASIASQLQIMTSSGFLAHVYDKLNLGDDEELIAKIPSVAASGSPEARQRAIIDALKEQLKIERRGLTYVVDIDATSRGPDKAAKFANAIADAYIDEQKKLRAATTGQATQWLGARIDAMRGHVASADQAVADFRADHNMIDAGAGNTLQDRQITDLTLQLGAARAHLGEAKAKYDLLQKVRLGEPSTLSDALQSVAITNLRGQYAAATRELASQLSTLGEKHPSVAQSRAQVADLRRQIDAELTLIRANVRNEYDLARSKEAELTNAFDRLKKSANGSDQAGVQLHELERQATATRTLYEQYLAREKETADQLSLPKSEARVISAAIAPSYSNRPKLLTRAGLATLLGLIAAAMMLLRREQREFGFQTPAQLQERLALPCLGLIPSAKDRSPGNRDYRATLANMREICRERQVVLIASANADDASASVAASFAEDAATHGAATLLIRFAEDRSGQAGIADMLYRGANLQSAIAAKRRSNLATLSAGALKRKQKPADLARDPRLGKIIAQCRQVFDVIIIDATPTVAGARSLMANADAAVLAIGWRSTDAAPIENSAEMLGAASAVPVHTVLYNVDLTVYGAGEATVGSKWAA